MNLILGFILAGFLSPAGFAAGLDPLSGSWESLDAYVSLGSCISAPSISVALCAPDQLALAKRSRLEFFGFLSGTNSAIDLSDAVKKERLSSADVRDFFSKYNYSEFLVSAKLQYISSDLQFLVGVAPVRYQGQLEVHNPNLPLVSFAIREDRQFFIGKAISFAPGKWKLGFGGRATLLLREERIVETTLVDLAARAVSDIIQKRKLKGSFFDLSASAEYNDFVKLAVLSSDHGGYWGGERDNSNRYLFIDYDKVPRATASLSIFPKVWHGVLQVGGGLIHFYERNNIYSKQWLGTISYYMGPVRLLAGGGDKLFRTGLGLSFSGYDVAVAQEWINKMESGRKAQPRFTLSVAASL